jgi:Flp pilus assembly pilin Flp
MRAFIDRVIVPSALRAEQILARPQSGQSMVEYAIIAALIAIAALAAVQALGVGITGVFQRILSSISGIG